MSATWFRLAGLAALPLALSVVLAAWPQALARDGSLARGPGDKDVKVWYDEGDGTIEVAVPEELRATPCLTPLHLDELHALAERCHRVWGPDLDIEWALGPDEAVYLLQCRPITTLNA